MRTLMTVLVACVVTIGIASANADAVVTGETTESVAPPSDGALDDAEDTGYECRYSPYCRKASQCTAYCAGGIPVCSNGCCACAS